MSVTATHGLKGKVEHIVREMDAMRQGQAPGRRDVTLRAYLAERNLTPGQFYSELGIEPTVTTVHQLMEGDRDSRWLMSEIVRDGVARGMGIAQRAQMEALRRAIAARSFAPIQSEANGGERWIAPEVWLDPIQRGVVQASFYQDLVTREIMVNNPTVDMPLMNLSDAAFADSGEAATIEEGTVTYETKQVRVRKRARAIKITYEAIKFNTLDLVQLFFEDVGRILAHTLNGDAVMTILDGDQDDNSEAAAVIGVADPTKGIQYRDALRVWVRMSLLGRRSTSIIGNELTATDYLMMEEVLKTQFNGRPIAPTTLKTPLPTQQNLYVSIKIPSNKLAFQDDSVSLVQLTAMPLLVESERIIMKQIEGTAASIMTGFAKLQRNASIVVDGSLNYNAAPLPAWMAPFAG